MNWEAIGAVAELLGAIGVIASLIYLATQIRHSRDQMQENTRAARSTAYQQLEHSVSERAMSQVTVPGLNRIVHLGMTDSEQLNEEESRQFHVWMHSIWRGYDNAYYQFKLGMFDEDRWQMSVRELKYTFQQPGVAAVWNTIGPTLSREFVAVVAEIRGEEPER